MAGGVLAAARQSGRSLRRTGTIVLTSRQPAQGGHQPKISDGPRLRYKVEKGGPH